VIINQRRLNEEGFPPQKELPARFRCRYRRRGAEPADGTDDLAFCLFDRIEHCSPSSPFSSENQLTYWLRDVGTAKREPFGIEGAPSPEIIWTMR
jgi:hypothetical protein